MPMQPRPLLMAAGALSEVDVLVESVQDHPCDPRACRECESLAGAIAVTHLLPRACRSTTELVTNSFGTGDSGIWGGESETCQLCTAKIVGRGCQRDLAGS